MSQSAIKLSVVTPCFNEAEVIGETYRRLTSVCLPYRSTYEIIFIDDGSTDETWPAIQSICQFDPHVVGVSLSRNHGHQLALTAGLTVAQGERILILDADLQDPPELLPEMMKVMDEGCEVVYGVRKHRSGETWLKLKTAQFFYRLLRQMSDIDIPADTGDFRLMSRRSLNVFLSMPERHRFVRGMVSWVGFRQRPLYYERQARFAGTSKYPWAKMIRFAFVAITGFSVKPLKIAIYVGLMIGLLAVLSLIYVLWSWLTGHVVAGWSSLMVVVLLIGSAQLFVLGIMGEYLGQIYLESKGRPLFIIDHIYRGKSASSEESGAIKGNSRES